MMGRSGISRALYVTALSQRVVILRVFIKKTENTPRHEIDLALSRAKLIKATQK
jgi:phage-related protein